MNKILVSDRNRESWMFFCNTKGDLCYEKDGKENILQSGVYEYFDIITDKGGNFHLIVQDSTGSLIYLTYNHKNWRKFVILNSKSARSCMSKFKLFILNGLLHCFYILDFDGKQMLTHHIFSSTQEWREPFVISRTDSSKSFSCCADLRGDIHIFFFDEDGKFRYRIYSTRTLKYEDSSIPVEDDIKNIYSICSSESELHLLYIARIKSYYALIYYNTLQRERKIISFSDISAADICMYVSDNSVYVQWRERQRFYQCKSEDKGATFKKPTPINETKNKRAISIKLRQPYNPNCFNADLCIALTSEDRVDILSACACLGSYKENIADNIACENHKSEKTDYNIIESISDEEVRFMQSKIHQNEKEIIRLNTIINTLSDKISCLAKSSAVPTQKKTDLSDNKPFECPTPPNEDGSVVNEENYELFKNTDIESIDFENSKNFS